MSYINWLLRRRGQGWIPDKPDDRDWPLDRLGLAVGETIPSEHSLEPHITTKLNQGSTEACVVHALAHAVDIRQTLLGQSSVPISRLFAYFNSRRFHSNPVTDSGTYIRTAIKGLRLFGVPDEAYWPWTTNPAKLNRRPGWEPYMMGHGRRLGDYYRIFETDSSRLREIKKAVSSGYPVGFGTKITADFVKDSGPTIIDKPVEGMPLVGGHAMLIVGYKPLSAAPGSPPLSAGGAAPPISLPGVAGVLFRVLNSWGTSWRDNGLAWLTEDYLTWNWTQDLTVIEAWQ